MGGQPCSCECRDSKLVPNSNTINVPKKDSPRIVVNAVGGATAKLDLEGKASGEALKEFRGVIKAKFRSRLEAFDKLGGSDDARIDRPEFHSFFREEMGYEDTKQIDRLFNLIDVNNDTIISPIEFTTFFEDQGSEQLQLMMTDTDPATIDFKQKLRETFKNRKDAFDKLGGSDDARIDWGEFQKFFHQELGQTDDTNIKRIFGLIDDNADGHISYGEFKTFLCDSGGNPDRRSTKQRNSLARKNTVIDASILEFRDALKGMFKTRKEAFDKLGGSDDSRIDKLEFESFFKTELGQYDDNRIVRIFEMIDDNGDGTISAAEFKAFFDVTEGTNQDKRKRCSSNASANSGVPASLVEFRKTLKGMFESRKEAFDKLGGKEGETIDRKRFEMFLRDDLQQDDVELINALWTCIDIDGDGQISEKEFKAAFDDRATKKKSSMKFATY